MNPFRTTISIAPFKKKISHSSDLFLVGSCFTEAMGKRLYSHGFSTAINLGGILYNPLSIETFFNNINHYNRDALIEATFLHNEKWHSWHHHSLFSKTTQKELLATIESSYHNGKHALEKSSYIVITLGSSRIYHHIKNDITVANCHKVDPHHFTTRYLTQSEIVESLTKTVTSIRNCAPNADILFTVSPVMHNKNKLQEHSRSKASLISAIFELCDTQNNLHYFPSYEIVTYDLRDYRFYCDDMIHPSEMAVDYIWNLFKESMCTKETKELASRCAKLYGRLQHHPFNPESRAYSTFKEKTESIHRELSGQIERALFKKESSWLID